MRPRLRFKALILLGLWATPAWAQQPAPAILPLPADARPAASLAAAPSVILSNGPVKAKVYLPGRPNSFYRGTRFDHFGTIGSLVYGGQEFYGPWFDQTAEVHDFIMAPQGVVAGPASADSGPVEEFTTDGKALGYDAAPVGGTFIKIGVGILRKPDDKPYDPYRAYALVDGGKNRTRTTGNAITFTQDLFDPNTGTGYHYVKTLRLVPGKPRLVIEHLLRNSGQTGFTTQVYDHNFLILSPGNADLQITVPYTLAPPARAPGADLLRLDAHSITYLRPLGLTERGGSVAMAGFGPSPSDYAFEIRNLRTGAGVAVRGDQPLVKMSMFAVHTIAAVEPTISMDLPVHGEKRWTYTYSYSAPQRP